MRAQLVIVLLVSLGLAPRAAARPVDACETVYKNSAAVDKIVSDEMARSGTPGVSIALIWNGRFVYAQGYGVKRKDPSDLGLVTCHTKFHAASLTKTVVATAIMTSFERGELAAADTLSKLFPTSTSSISIADLLTHRSGMRNWHRAKMRRTTREQAAYLEDILSASNRRLTKGRFRYSDTNYNLLGMILEQTTGKSLHDVLTKRVFRPLEMTDSTVQLTSDAAWPHVGSKNRPAKNHPFDIAFAGSSGMQTSAYDLGLFALAHLNRNERVMPAKVYQAGQCARFSTEWDGIRQSYIWQVVQRKRTSIIQHGGTDTGFRALMTAYPDRKAAIIILANGEKLDRWGLRSKLEAVLFTSKIDEQSVGSTASELEGWTQCTGRWAN